MPLHHTFLWGSCPRHFHRLPSPTRDPFGPPKVGSRGVCGRRQLPLMAETPARPPSALGHTAQLSKVAWVLLPPPQRHWKCSSTAGGRSQEAGTGRRRSLTRHGRPAPRPPGACAAPPLRTGKMAASALGWALRAARQVSPAPSLPRCPLGPHPARRGAAGLGRPLGEAAAGSAPAQTWPEPRGAAAGTARRCGCHCHGGSFASPVWEIPCWLLWAQLDHTRRSSGRSSTARKSFGQV